MRARECMYTVHQVYISMVVGNPFQHRSSISISFEATQCLQCKLEKKPITVAIPYSEVYL